MDNVWSLGLLLFSVRHSVLRLILYAFWIFSLSDELVYICRLYYTTMVLIALVFCFERVFVGWMCVAKTSIGLDYSFLERRCRFSLLGFSNEVLV